MGYVQKVKAGRAGRGVAGELNLYLTMVTLRPRMTPRRAPARLGLIAASLAIAACGGGSRSTTTTPAASSTTTTTAASSPATSTTATTAGGTSKVTTGPVRGSLTAPDHAPVAGKGWPYSLKVSDAAGKPLAGTVDIEFLFGGQVVGRDTPPTHPLASGTWHDVLTFPAEAIGQPLTFQAVVHTSQGSITLDWRVEVKR